MSTKSEMPFMNRGAILRALAAYDRGSEEHKKIYEDLKSE